MARVLIAWELGDAFGHFARVLRLVEGLRGRGHTLVLALKDLRLPAGARLAPEVLLVQAPLSAKRAQAGPPPLNYAGLLLACGFERVDDLAGRLAAWRGLMQLTGAELLVADHAPTALLAAHSLGIAHLSVGNGFAVPPPVHPWPPLRPWRDTPAQALAAAEAGLDERTREAGRRLGLSGPLCMRTLFGPQDVLDTFAELDHYGPRARACYVGPLVTLPGAMPVAWQDAGARKVLAYLRPEAPGFDAALAALDALARCDAEVLCVAPGVLSEQARGMASPRLRIALAPVDLPPLLAGADLAIGHGGCGFATQALLAGVPVLAWPRHVEQALLGRRLQALGLGRLIVGRGDAAALLANMQALLNEPEARRAARAFSERHRAFSPARALARAVSAIEQRIAPLEKPSPWLH